MNVAVRLRVLMDGLIEERIGQASEAGKLREAFLSHYPGLLRMCVLVTGRREVAEDLVQEAFVRAAGAIERLPADEIRPYLRAAAMNIWRNRLRRLALERRAQPTLLPAEEVSIEERHALWETIRKLPAGQRACLVLRYYEDLSERETARILGSAVGTVKSQTSRALRRLRKDLSGERH